MLTTNEGMKRVRHHPLFVALLRPRSGKAALPGLDQVAAPGEKTKNPSAWRRCEPHTASSKRGTITYARRTVERAFTR